MLLIFGLLLIFIFGLLLSTVIVEKMHLIERLGNIFLLGFGIFTLVMFCYSVFGIKITLQSILVASGVLNICLFILLKILKRKIRFDIHDLLMSFVRMPALEKTIICFIGIFFIGSFIISSYFPVYIWDALALYDFRARVIAEQGFYVQIANNFFWFAGYPLFTSLSHTFVYLFGGKNPQFLYSLMYISFAFIFYSALRQLTSRRAAMITTLILVTTPVFFDHSTFAYTNLPYSIFLSMGTIYLFVWFAKNKSVGYLILSAIMTGLSTWTRSTEPFWIINIIFLIIISIYRYKKYLLNTVWYILSFLAVREPWNIVNYNYLTEPGVEKPSVVIAEVNSYIYSISKTVFDWQRVVDVVVFIYKNVITSWYPVLFIFLFCLFFKVRYIFKKISTVFLLIIIAHFCFLLYATYIFSIYQSSWQSIPDSARRMSMFFLPLMEFYIGLALGLSIFDFWPKSKLKKYNEK